VAAGSGAHHNQISCNRIVDNGDLGVRVEGGAHHNLIGWVGDGNLISGNGSDGVLIEGPTTDFNQVVANFVGTDQSGQTARANTGHGVRIIGRAQFNLVGGELPGYGNVISGNDQTGVMLEGNETMFNRLGDNLIGLAADGQTPLGNGQHGVGIYSGASHTQIGSSVLPPNTIGANGWSGVAIVQSDLNAIVDGLVGTNASGATNLGNTYYGVHIVGGSHNAVSTSTIAHNGRDGVRVDGAAALYNYITNNSITANVGKGIENINGGNSELAPPVITNVFSGSVSGTSTCAAGCTVELFTDPSNEGENHFGFAFVQADGSWSWTGTVPSGNVTATVSDGSLNTSEFSAPYGGANTWQFSGHVFQYTDPPMYPLPAAEGVEVSLYGSHSAGELQELLARTWSQEDGGYTAAITVSVPFTPTQVVASQGDFPYLILAISDPRVQVKSADSGSGGEVTESGWIVFQEAGTGQYGLNDFVVSDLVTPGLADLHLLPVWEMADVQAVDISNLDLWIQGIEVTQGMQCFDTSQGLTGCADNSVPLIAAHRTMIRVYIGGTHTGQKTKVRLHLAFDSAQTSQVTTGISSASAVARHSLDASADWVFTWPDKAGSIQIWAELDPDNDWNETSSTSRPAAPYGPLRPTPTGIPDP